MHHSTNLDTLIARIALSLWSSERRVERLPVVVVVNPWERAALVAVPQHLRSTRAFKLAFRSEGI